MKKFWALLVVTIVVLVGCGKSSIEKRLTEGEGKWRIAYGMRDSNVLKFYEDGNIEIYDGNSIALTGTYEVNKKEKRIIITTPKGKRIFNDVKLKKDGNISVVYGESQNELTKEE